MTEMHYEERKVDSVLQSRHILGMRVDATSYEDATALSQAWDSARGRLLDADVDLLWRQNKTEINHFNHFDFFSPKLIENESVNRRVERVKQVEMLEHFQSF